MRNISSLFSSTLLASLSEQKGSLCQEWLNGSYDEKLFKLFVPEVYGGLGLDLLEALRLEEKLAKADGSLGWTVTLCAGAGWFVGFMEESLRKSVFSDPKVCLAGSGFVGGKADRRGESYLINGSWTYASGAVHGTHFTANCEILENGIPSFDPEGNPIVKAFILKASEVQILDSWKYMGMIATGSNAFQTDNLIVPENRCFEILPEKALLDEPIYQFPFLQFAEATLTANIVGITQHFQRLVKECFELRKEKKAYSWEQLAYFDHTFSKEVEELVALRMGFYQTIGSAWEELISQKNISSLSLQKVSLISRKLVQFCRESNARLFPFAGLEAAQTETELNRVWRDFNTVSQHSLLTFPF